MDWSRADRPREGPRGDHRFQGVDVMAEYVLPDPVVQIAGVQEVARDLVVIPNRGVQLVPNIGVIGGARSVLVVDTGMGPRNAEKVLEFAADYAAGRELYLTTTHFHPEHAFGAQVFAGQATFLINRGAGAGPGHERRRLPQDVRRPRRTGRPATGGRRAAHCGPCV